ncbi:TonB-dependent siderophore receptor [Pleionea sp. CnH1-48]|uniref:TonB-dependent receptor plug domain-containing protein n=1 Tax=Pleionea sp. CnH1-48 TaxID=2954494 RepID=UPI0020985E64|nr:TonB-dependent receptor [Pleionea sp. CnH1-48]MCO7223932.1 TonB-dependent receptor [Pleionea sp. CnH1-48]
MKNHIITLLILMLCQTVSFSCYGQEDISDEISLEDLLSLDVSGVSKKKESVEKAPGIVTVISAEQIRELGARNLTDALARVPGVFSFDNYFSLTDQFSIRGNLSEDYNTKILFLINGHPSYHTLTGTFFSDMIPIEAVERIEVVRGPVSVLYGTNALTGVINIITKQSLENDAKATASVETSSHDTFTGQFNVIQQWDENSQVFIALEAKRTDGFVQGFDADQDDSFFSFKDGFVKYPGNGGSAELGEEHTSLFTQLKVNDFELDLSYFDQERQTKQGIQPSFYFRGGPFDINLLSLDARYKMELNENMSLRFIGRYDDYEYSYTVGNYQELDNGITDTVRTAVGDWLGSKHGLEVIADIAYDKWDVIAGIMWDQYEADAVNFKTGQPSTHWITNTPLAEADFPLIPEDSENSDTAIYANGRYRFSEDVEGIAGFRFTDNDASGTNTDFRLGGIFSLTPKTIFKVLYGTSYRSANLNEYNVNAFPVIVGNSELDFEVLKGLDLSISHRGDKYKVELVYFMNETDDEINTVADVSSGFPVPTFSNIEGKETKGVEFDATYIFSERTKAYVRGSILLDVTDTSTNSDISNGTINDVLAFGITWSPQDKVTLDLNGFHNGDWLTEGSYSVYNMGILYEATDSLDVYLYGHNITDKDYDYAIWQGAWQSTSVPAARPMTLHLGFTQQF